MKAIKKFTAIMINSVTTCDNNRVFNEVVPKLTYGNVTGPYYDEITPQTEFDTEDEAIEYCYKINKYANWLIVPVISFDIFDENE